MQTLSFARNSIFAHFCLSELLHQTTRATALSIALDNYVQHHLANVGEITWSWPELCKSPTCPMHHQARQSAVKSSICGSFNLISSQPSPAVKWRVMSIARRIFNCDLITYACALIIITIAVVYGRYFSKTSSLAPTTAFASTTEKCVRPSAPKY